MARNSEIFLGDDYISSIKLGDDNLKIYLQDTLVYQYGISLDDAIVTCNVATYNGNPQSATTIQVTLSGSQLTLNEDFIVTSNSGGTNVGSYNVTIEGIGLYIGEASGTFTINKVTPTVTAPTAKSLTYNGSAQALANAGSTDFGTLEYSTASTGTFTTSIPTKTSAGTYEVWYRVVGDSNINDVAAQKTTNDAVINKADVVITTAPTKKTGLVYNTSAQDLLNAGTVTGGTLQYSSNNTNWSTTIPQGTNVNSYTVYWRVKGDSNHNDYPSTMISDITISPKVVTNPTITLSQDTYTYDGNTKTPAVSSVNDGGNVIPVSEYTVSYSNNVNASTSATVTISDNVNGNYTVSGTKTFTINKVNPCPDIVAPTPKTLTYNTSAQALANAGSTPFGTMQYCLNNSGGTYSTSVPSATNANVTYKVWYKVVGDSNVEDCSPQSIDCMIAEKRVTTPTIEVAACTYNGNAQTPTVTVKDGSTVIPSSEYTVSYSNNINAGNGTVVISDNTLGNYYISGTTTFTIAKSAITNVTIAVSPTSFTYNSGIQKPTTVTVKSGNNALTSGTHYTLSYSDSNSTNVGTYTISASPTSNYSFTVVSANYSIGCSTPTAPTAKNPNWTGSAQALVNAGSTYGTMIYSTTSGGTYSTTIPTGTNAGSYEVWWKVSGNTNVCDYNTPQKVSCSIKKVPMEYKAPSATTYTYDNTAHAAAIGGSATGGSIQYCTTSGGTYSTTIPTNTNAGTYDVWWKAVPDSNHSGGTSAAKLTATINCYSAIGPTNKNPTYTGSAIAYANSGSTSYGTMVYCSTSGGTFTNSLPTATNAGSYDCWWKVTGNTNVCNTAATKVACSIAKAAMTCCTPSVKSGLVYNGSAQVLVTDCKPTGGDIYYATASGGTGSATTVPSATDAGTYNRWYKCVPDSNHSGGTSSWTKLACSIAKKNVVCTAPVKKTLTYTGSAQALASTGSCEGGTIKYCSTSGGTYSTTMPTGTNAGSYTVWYKCEATATTNYSGTCSGSVACSIAQKAISIPTPTGVNKVYNGNASTATFPATTGANITKYRYSTNGSSWTETTVNPLITDVGTLYSQAYYKANDSNYSGENWTTTATLTVTKAAMSYTAPSGATRTYSTSAQQLVSGQSVNGGSIYYATASGGTGSATTIPTAINAGSYDRWWKAIPDSNHSGGTSSWAKVTGKINAKTVSSPTITLSPTGYTYSGSACKPTPTVKDGSTTIASSEYTVSYSNNTNAGTATCTITDVSGGNYTVSGSKTFTIAKKTGCTISFATTAVTKTYGNAAFTNAITNSGDGTVSWSAGTTSVCTVNSSGKVTIVGAGTCTIKATVANSTNCTYSTTAATYTITVNKAAGSVSTAPTAKSLTYTGSAQALVNAGSGTGTMLYKVGSGSWGTAIPSGTNAGSYTVYYKASASTNYNESASASTGVTIAKAAMSYTAPKVATRTYTGNAQQLVSGQSVNGGSIYYATASTGAGSATTVPSATNAGSYDRWWKALPDSNHSGGTSSWTKLACSIAKAACCSTAPKACGLTYNGNGQNLVSGGSSSCGTMQYATATTATYSTTIPQGVNYGTYTTYWKVSNDANHSGTCSGSVSTTISRASRTLCLYKSGSTVLINGTSVSLDPGSLTTINWSTSGSSTAGTFTYSTANSSITKTVSASTNSFAIMPIKRGTCVITANIAASGNYAAASASFSASVVNTNTVNIQGYIWSRFNLGSSTEQGYGTYYQYGKTSGLSSTSGQSDYNGTGTTLPTSDDAAYKSKGENWCIPTTAHFDSLFGSNTTKTWTTVGGINGLKIADKNDTNSYIFLPAGGFYVKTGSSYTLQNQGVMMTYRTSNTQATGSTTAAYVQTATTASNIGRTTFAMSNAALIRPVRKDKVQ